MKKETNEKSSSGSGKVSDCLFRGIMCLLYGKKAGETALEKITRLGVLIIILVTLIFVFSAAKQALFP